MRDCKEARPRDDKFFIRDREVDGVRELDLWILGSFQGPHSPYKSDEEERRRVRRLTRSIKEGVDAAKIRKTKAVTFPMLTFN